jgi:hypothetical protein
MSIEIRLRLRIELNDLLWRQYPLFVRKSGIGKKEERERNYALQTDASAPRHPRKYGASKRRSSCAAVIDFEIEHRAFSLPFPLPASAMSRAG